MGQKSDMIGAHPAQDGTRNRRLARTGAPGYSNHERSFTLRHKGYYTYFILPIADDFTG
jgi:hypothetical protein